MAAGTKRYIRHPASLLVPRSMDPWTLASEQACVERGGDNAETARVCVSCLKGSYLGHRHDATGAGRQVAGVPAPSKNSCRTC